MPAAVGIPGYSFGEILKLQTVDGGGVSGAGGDTHSSLSGGAEEALHQPQLQCMGHGAETSCSTKVHCLYTPQRCWILHSDWLEGVNELTVGWFTHRFAEFLHSGAHITPSELQSHERHHAFGVEYNENTLLDSTHAPAAAKDFSDDEINTYRHNPPNPSSFSSLPAVPPLLALPTPPAYTASPCPYPAMPYTPEPEHPLTDDDEPF